MVQETKKWRLIIERNVKASWGLAVDELLANFVSKGESAPLLHIYTFLPSVIVGRYQNMEAAVNLFECSKLGIDYNRRHTGGGTVLMGADQLALGFAIPLSHPRMESSMRGSFELLGGIICRSLQRIGIEANFQDKNDLKVRGRKIAGMAASLEEKRTFFFHMSLLIDFDLPLMLKVLKISPYKSPEQGLSCFSRRLTTIREQGVKTSFAEVAEIIQQSLAQEFAVKWKEDEFTVFQKKKINDLRKSRYESLDWLFRVRSPGTRKVCVERKTPGGLLQVYLTLSRGTIESLLISGDFFSTAEEVARVESALRWTRARRNNVKKVLQEVMEDGKTIYRVDASTLTDIIMEGVELCQM
jgi:lipoate-protein ligase A